MEVERPASQVPSLPPSPDETSPTPFQGGREGDLPPTTESLGPHAGEEDGGVLPPPRTPTGI